MVSEDTSQIFFSSSCFEDDEKIGIEQVRKLFERQEVYFDGIMWNW